MEGETDTVGVGVSLGDLLSGSANEQIKIAIEYIMIIPTNIIAARAILLVLFFPRRPYH